jgi:hypothetical protein
MYLFIVLSFVGMSRVSFAMQLTANDADDVNNALLALADGEEGMWTQHRSGIPPNQPQQILQQHLFINHNGAVGHTAIVTAAGAPYPNANGISGAVAGVVGALNGHIAVNPIAFLRNIANATKIHQARMRQVTINLPAAIVPANVRVIHGGIVAAPIALNIWLPLQGNMQNNQIHRLAGSMIPCTVFLD